MKNTQAPLPARARAIRTTLVCVILAFSFLPIVAAQMLGKVREIANDMLGGQPLPPITEAAFAIEPLFSAIGFAIPFIAFSMLFVRDLIWPFFVLAGLFLIGGVQCIWIGLAIIPPFTTITDDMWVIPPP